MTAVSTSNSVRVHRSLFVLVLFCSIPCHAFRNRYQLQLATMQLGGQSGEDTDLAANSTERSNIICFGLCIAGIVIASIAGVGLIAGTTTAIVVSLNNNGNQDHLSKLRVGNREIAKIVSQAVELSLSSEEDVKTHQNLPALLQKMTTEEILEHAEALVPVSGVGNDILRHTETTCGRSVFPKDLKKAGSSSRSGAIFFNCATPGTRGLMLTVGDKLQAHRDSKEGNYKAGDIGTIDAFGEIATGEKRFQVTWPSGRWTTQTLDRWWENFEQLSNVQVDTDQDLPRVLLKAGIRDSDSSPEWSTFQAMSSRIDERYRDETLLNKMVLGFTAFDLHWLAMQDVKADPLIEIMKRDLGISSTRASLSHTQWHRFDIKPAGSRAPMLPECFEQLSRISKRMGPINQFKGWARMTGALAKDLDFLKAQKVIDESLFIQTLGPFATEPFELTSIQEYRLMEVLGNAPMCAFQHQRGYMAIVCVTILDYVLSFSFMKNIQNVFQANRWDKYEEKMIAMMDCVGDMSSASCSNYKSAASGHWQEIVSKLYDELPEDDREDLGKLEQDWDCCCNTTETSNAFTMDTMCAWLEHKRFTRRCPRGLDNIKLREGGCFDVEPQKLE